MDNIIVSVKQSREETRSYRAGCDDCVCAEVGLAWGFKPHDLSLGPAQVVPHGSKLECGEMPHPFTSAQCARMACIAVRPPRKAYFCYGRSFMSALSATVVDLLHISFCTSEHPCGTTFLHNAAHPVVVSGAKTVTLSPLVARDRATYNCS
jgi:hypothetical protein